MARLQVATPLFLSASATLNPGEVISPNAVALKNPSGDPCEIHEIRFEFYVLDGLFATVPADYLRDYRGLNGGGLGVKFNLGPHQLTNGFVPVWSFMRSVNEVVEEPEYASVGAAKRLGGERCWLRWRLARPLLIPPGLNLTPTFQHRNQTQQRVFIRVSYIGRELARSAPVPQKIHVPWVAAWQSQNYAIGAAGTENSAEQQLTNPHPEPVVLDRLVGRINRYDPVLAINTERTLGFAGWTLMRFGMTSSDGRVVVPTDTSFRDVFPPETRSWELPQAEMAPYSYYLVELRKKGLVAPTTNTQVQAFISLVGSREIALKRTA